MSITGNILIDKLRINIPLRILNGVNINVESYKPELKNILEKYFVDKNAYSVTVAYNYLRITLTPTRFKPDGNSSYTDTNLEMPSEEWLLQLFQKLGFDKDRKIDEAANITWIHLTKNIITNKKPLEYIMFLANFPLKRRFISSLISSSSQNTTLRLATQKRNTNRKDIIGDRTYIFYDKTQELQDKVNRVNITLKHKLTNNEIEYISQHGGLYDISANSLNLSSLNLLRCELQYRYKHKIKPLKKFLNSKPESSSLTLSIILDLLYKKELYAKLEEYYTNELQSVVFYRLPDKLNKQPTSYKRAFADLLNCSDLVTLELLYNSFELGKIFKNNKVASQTINEDLYTELYNKFI